MTRTNPVTGTYSRTSDWTYLRNRAHLRKTCDVCWLCGKTIDPALKFPHPHSFTADHLVPIAKGGHMHGELRAAHLHCNISRARAKHATRHTR